MGHRIPSPKSTVPTTRAEQRELRAIAGAGWTGELERALADLEGRFRDWRARRIDAFELAAAIHAFHHGPGRDLYRAYATAGPAFGAARAVHLGLVPAESVSDDVRQRLGPILELFEAHDARRSTQH